MKTLLFLMLLSQIAICNTQKPTKAEIYDTILLYAKKYNLDPRVMIAQAYTESSLNPMAVNDQEKTKHRSSGLFQIQEPTALSICKMTKHQIMVMRNNVKCAAIISDYLMKRFRGDDYQYIKMLYAYNAGHYYICKKRPGSKCRPGKPVNYSYLINIIGNYIRLAPELESLSFAEHKSVNFLALSKKYIDSL